MKIIDFQVELHARGEVTINGRAVEDQEAAMTILEDVIAKQVPPIKQWFVICELNKRIAQLRHLYDKSRVAWHELTPEEYMRIKAGVSKPGSSNLSASGGIQGTNIGTLNPYAKGK